MVTNERRIHGYVCHGLKHSLVPAILAGLVVISLFVTARADMVTDWNDIATRNAALAGKNPLAQSRIYAMVHAAIHDALNAIERRYKPYALDSRASSSASPDAAVAAAAYYVLVHELPTRQAELDEAFAALLSGIPDGGSKTSGIAIGQAAAVAILNLRSADGSNIFVPYTPGTDPGDWQPTPPAFVPAFLPGWGSVTPFTLISGSQFRPDPSDFFDLSSKEYAREFNEVKRIGEVNSDTRSDEQSEIAKFWYEGSPDGWNRIARVVSAQKCLGLWENGRLFGLLNFAMADGYISGFDAKYVYNFWRPITAIRAAEMDGNDNTLGDVLWTPFLVTPPSPDYTSTHSVLGAAAAHVLARFFGDDDISFVVTSGNPFPGITRSFMSFSQAAAENADSRVYAGIHFRSACRDGLRQGRKVGHFAFTHFLRPANRIQSGNAIMAAHVVVAGYLPASSTFRHNYNWNICVC